MTPEIIAHRGASYLAPENTLSAFRKAMEIGADGVEMDVQQTRDKKLVIHHDFVIDWHTDMRGQIYDMTEGELKALDFGSWKDVNYRNERIATLQEALALCREMEGTIVQLEMKATIDDDPDFVPRVIEEVRAANITDRLVVISFNHDLLRQAKQLMPELKVGVLVYGDEGEGTLKRYIQRGNCVVLQPFNPAYNELVIKGEDLNRLHIAGRVVETKAKW